MIAKQRARISTLGYEKQKAIESLDYDKAQELEDEINKLHGEMISNQFIEIKRDTLQEAESYVSQFRGAIDSRGSMVKETDNAIYAKYVEYLGTLQEKHISEELSLNNECKMEIEASMKEPVEEEKELLDKSRICAQNCEFDEAKRLKNEARKKSEEIIKQRGEHITEVYNKKMEELNARQDMEIEELKKKFNYENTMEQSKSMMAVRSAEHSFRSHIELLKKKSSIRIKALSTGEDEINSFIASINRELDQIAEYAMSQSKTVEKKQKSEQSLVRTTQVARTASRPISQLSSPSRLTSRL